MGFLSRALAKQTFTKKDEEVTVNITEGTQLLSEDNSNWFDIVWILWTDTETVILKLWSYCAVVSHRHVYLNWGITLLFIFLVSSTSFELSLSMYNKFTSILFENNASTNRDNLVTYSYPSWFDSTIHEGIQDQRLAQRRQLAPA